MSMTVTVTVPVIVVAAAVCLLQDSTMRYVHEHWFPSHLLSRQRLVEGQLCLLQVVLIGSIHHKDETMHLTYIQVHTGEFGGVN